MLKGKNTMNDKPKQTIEKRLFWSDFSVNTVLDTLYSTLYDSTLFVKINDGFSYVMKNSKTKFPKGINGCVSQKYIDVYFEKPIEGGFCSTNCQLPSYQWTMNEGYLLFL